jgi:hypothetical protein
VENLHRRAGNIYVADTLNHAVRVIDTSGMIHRLPDCAPRPPASGTAVHRRNSDPRVACDANGNVFICDTGNHAIRMVTPAGIISTVAGSRRPRQRHERRQTRHPISLNLPYGIDIIPTAICGSPTPRTAVFGLCIAGAPN